jgi:hypothetical protein
MTSHPIARLEKKERTGQRPAGYAQAVIRAGAVVGDDVWLTPEQHAALRERFNPSPTHWPTLAQLAVNFAAATAHWASKGFPVCPRETYETRAAKCALCPHWKSTLGIGRCQLCGCAKFKLWLATEKCPQNLW